MLLAGVALVQGSLLAQQPAAPGAERWDTPHSLTTWAIVDGRQVAPGEILLILHDWSDRHAVSAVAATRDGRILGGIASLKTLRVSVPEGREAEEVTFFSALAEVSHAQFNHVLHPASEDTGSPNDTYFPKQWQLENTGQTVWQVVGKVGADIDALSAWKIQRGNPSVIVAVIDTGIRLDHPEFAGRLVPGHDFISEDDDPSSAIGHGTWVAGLLAANGDNAYGTIGADRACRIMPLRAITAGGGLEFDIAQAIDFASMWGVDIISMSIGTPISQVITVGNEALKRAAESGCILVAAAGNAIDFGSANTSWPGKSPWTISVGFTDNTDRRWFASATGNALDFVAPGVKVPTVDALVPFVDQFTPFTGSSAATPLASAIAALLLAESPGMTQDEVYELLRLGAEDEVGDPAEDTPGWDPYHGHGRLNAARSLQALCNCTGDEDFWGSPGVLKPGRVQMLTLNAGPAFAGATYWILGSLSGSRPPTVLGHLELPLVGDRYFEVTLGSPSALIREGTGRLDDEGRARAALQLPANVPSVLLGMTFHHAYVLLQGGQPAYVSRAIGAEVVPN